MLKIIPISLILFMLTNVFYSQMKIVPKDVEHRMDQNRNSHIQTFEGIYVIYSFKNMNMEKRSQSESFDHLLLKNNQLKIKSCATSEVNGVFNTVIIAHGFVTVDDIKYIVYRNGGNFVEWKAVYALSENVSFTAPKNDVNAIRMPRGEYDQLPAEKKQYVLDNAHRYIIVD